MIPPCPGEDMWREGGGEEVRSERREGERRKEGRRKRSREG